MEFRLFFVLAVLGLLVIPALSVDAVTEEADNIVEGVVRLDEPVRLKSSAVKVLVGGGEQVAFVRANGHFALRLDPGTHFLQVSAVGATFPQVRVDVSAKHRGRFKSSVLVEGRTVYTATDELTIAPIGPEVYFDKRQPFNVWSVLKSPMGMMLIFMLVVAVVMPMLMDSIDPEEMKQMQEDMKKQPSLTALLSGGSTGPLAPPVTNRR